jgi:hypothetical protein
MQQVHPEVFTTFRPRYIRFWVLTIASYRSLKVDVTTFTEVLAA